MTIIKWLKQSRKLYLYVIATGERCVTIYNVTNSYGNYTVTNLRYRLEEDRIMRP